MKESDPDKTEILTTSLKSAAAIMERESIPYLLGGGLGTWAHGGASFQQRHRPDG